MGKACRPRSGKKITRLDAGAALGHKPAGTRAAARGATCRRAGGGAVPGGPGPYTQEESLVKRSLLLAPLAASLALAAGFALAQLPRTKAPAGAVVYFIEPAEGAQLSSPVTVKFGLRGMGVAPAGVDSPDTGHHHLLVDAALGDPAQPIPADKTHIHFGKGQTEAQVELPPGEHTLQLVVGDKLHIPHDPPVLSQPIRITVK
jgi:hypothetical protein